MATIKGYTPHEKQKQIHYSINKESYKYYILNIGRQFGKTMLGINQMLYWAINHKGCSIAWVTPIYKQGKKVFDELEAVTKNSGLFEYNRSDLTISGFGSKIQFFSGERPDNIRGNTFDYLIIDETAFTRSELWSEVLSATVLVKGKKVIFISTPKGKNHFYQLSMQHNYDERYKYFQFTSYDNPMIDKADLDERKRSLPDHIFRQEYLAEFIDNASGNLQQSIVPTKISPELIDVTAPFYWKYINYGVNGTEVNRGAPTHGPAPSTGVSFHDAIKKWIYDKGISIPEGMTHDGLAYAIQGKLKTEGQKATHFFDKVINDEKKDYMKESISNLIGESIKLVIKKPK